MQDDDGEVRWKLKKNIWNSKKCLRTTKQKWFSVNDFFRSWMIFLSSLSRASITHALFTNALWSTFQHRIELSKPKKYLSLRGNGLILFKCYECLCFVNKSMKIKKKLLKPLKPMKVKTNTWGKSLNQFFNLLLSAGAGEAALLTLALEYGSLLWLPLELEIKGSNEDRFIFKAAAVKPAGGKFVLVLAATGAGWLNWSDKLSFKFCLLKFANGFWSTARGLLRKFVFKRLEKIPSDLSPNMLDDVATPFK